MLWVYASTLCRISMSIFYLTMQIPGMQRSVGDIRLSAAPLPNSVFQMRGHIVQHLYMLTTSRWDPSHSSADDFLKACQFSKDPLRIRFAAKLYYFPGWFSLSSIFSEGLYVERIEGILRQFPKWREERLPPPRVSQSEVSTPRDLRLGRTPLIF